MHTEKLQDTKTTKPTLPEPDLEPELQAQSEVSHVSWPTSLPSPKELHVELEDDLFDVPQDVQGNPPETPQDVPSDIELFKHQVPVHLDDSIEEIEVQRLPSEPRFLNMIPKVSARIASPATCCFWLAQSAQTTNLEHVPTQFHNVQQADVEWDMWLVTSDYIEPLKSEPAILPGFWRPYYR